MASDIIQIRADGEDIAAEKMLLLATQTIKLLKAIERDRSKKRAVIPWRVNMMSGHTYGMIQIFATGKMDGEADAEKVVQAYKNVARKLATKLTPEQPQ